jgi:CBS-domain-containing membrane protein
MTSRVLSVGPDALFAEIATVLFTGAVRAVPVLDGDGRSLGVVSEADLLVTVEREVPAPGVSGGVRGTPGSRDRSRRSAPGRPGS